MGIYLNSISSYSLYKSEYTRPYFVDKSNLLKELIPLASREIHIYVLPAPGNLEKLSWQT